MPVKYIFLAVIANVVAGTSYLSTDYLLDRGFSPAQSAIARLSISTLFLIPVLFRTARQFSLRDHLLLVVAAVVSIYIPTHLSIYGLELSTTVNASLLLGSESVFIVILAWMFLHELVDKAKASGIALGMFGIVLIALQGIPGINATISISLGDSFFLIAAACWASYVLFLKFLHQQDEPMGVVAWICLHCTVLGVFRNDYDWSMLRQHAWTWLDVVVLLHVSVGLMILVCYCWNVIIRHVESSRYAPYLFLQPVIGVALGAMFLQETLSVYHVAGGVCILAGIYLTTITASAVVDAAAVAGFHPLTDPNISSAENQNK